MPVTWAGRNRWCCWPSLSNPRYLIRPWVWERKKAPSGWMAPFFWADQTVRVAVATGVTPPGVEVKVGLGSPAEGVAEAVGLSGAPAGVGVAVGLGDTGTGVSAGGTGVIVGSGFGRKPGTGVSVGAGAGLPG